MNLYPRRNILFSLLILSLASAASPYVGQARNSIPQETISMKLGMEREGVSLAHIYLPHRLPREERIRISLPNRSYSLQSLSQLKGRVRISTSSQALDFVRLRTCLALLFAWNNREIRTEVLNREQLNRLPTFGMEEFARSLHASQARKSGLDGVLSPEAYRKGHFSAPVIETTRKGFKITRWQFVFDCDHHRNQVQQTGELVGKDGSYKIQILKAKRPPTLPDTTWAIPLRR